MPDLKISQLTNGNPAQTNDQIPINRGGVNFSITAGSISALPPTTAGANQVVYVDSAGTSMDGDAGFTFNPTTGAVLSLNTSTNALRITQTGTGNALLVEDSTNPDSTPVVIDANGRVIQGSTASISYDGEAELQINGIATQSVVARYSASVGGPRIKLAKSRAASIGTNTIVNSGDYLGDFQFLGADGSSYVIGASIRGEVDGTPATNDMPGRLVFATTLDGASSPTERMRIDNAGIVYINTTTNTNSSRLVVNGTISETVSSTQYLVASQYDVGTAPNQIPLNQYLGTLAFQDSTAVSVGQLRANGTGGIGYSLGAGSAVTQITSRTTGVTINAACGAITLVSAAGQTAYQTFTVTNSVVAATDTIVVNQKSGTDLNIILVTAVAAGSFNISFATTGGTTTEQPVFNFAVIKAVAA